jgi:hypothetical protein
MENGTDKVSDKVGDKVNSPSPQPNGFPRRHKVAAATCGTGSRNVVPEAREHRHPLRA